jgi:hypothetical protein
MKRSYKQLFFAIFILVLLVVIWQEYYGNRLDPTMITDKLDLGPACQVPLQISSEDKNNNNIPDALDLVQGARQEVERGTVYDASYYSGRILFPACSVVQLIHHIFLRYYPVCAAFETLLIFINILKFKFRNLLLLNSRYWTLLTYPPGLLPLRQ